MSETRGRIPSVDALLRSPSGIRASERLGRPLLKAAVRQVLGGLRADPSDDAPSNDALLGEAVAIATGNAMGIRPSINATGVLLHTGLGRAPLSEEAANAAARVARGYADLEIDRESGDRGRRTARADAMLTALTGAEAALVVNNNAAALLLTLAALAKRKEVLVSRGELIEIGGEFRLPDILAASGAKLVEVGTTNRTRVSDYRAAITERTALILKVHPSNYRIVGFQQSPTVAQLAQVAAKAAVHLVHDIGSGLLTATPGVPDEEPSAAASLAAGADLVCFSGDKLLGGPQAGILLGRSDLLDRVRRNPVARAVRVDRMQVAALESVLAIHARGSLDELPVWRMLHEPATAVRERAADLARALDGDLEGAHVVASEASVGGGSVPGFSLPSWSVAVRTPDPETFATHLRTGNPPVFCRIDEGHVSFDLRTVTADDVADLARAIGYAMESDEGREDA